MEDYCVLMTVYHKDKPNELKQSIESMINQTIPCKQFVIYIDGPVSSEILGVIDEYKLIYPELFTVQGSKENNGLGKALDSGLNLCNYELIARMDADDISLPTRCEKLLKLFDEHPKLGLAGTNIDEFCDCP